MSYNWNFFLAKLLAFFNASTPFLLLLKSILSTLSSTNLSHSAIMDLTFVLSVLLALVLYNELNFLFITIKSLKVAGVIFFTFSVFSSFLGLYFFTKSLITFWERIVAGVSVLSITAVALFIAVATEAVNLSMLLFPAWKIPSLSIKLNLVTLSFFVTLTIFTLSFGLFLFWYKSAFLY